MRDRWENVVALRVVALRVRRHFANFRARPNHALEVPDTRIPIPWGPRGRLNVAVIAVLGFLVVVWTTLGVFLWR